MSHTKTFTVLHPWAETVPWACLVRPTACIHPTHDHSPMVGDPCAACGEPLLEYEACYSVIEIRQAADARHPPWVCWRHVRPDDGPVRTVGSR